MHYKLVRVGRARYGVFGSTFLPRLPDPDLFPRLPDSQGWSTLMAGALLLRISFITSYGDDKLLPVGRRSQPLTRSEWVSTLPPWRRLLA
jgi:hypothetical protein